jgi:transcription initiation factor TFIIIB Brf1 subunit/transcription initiation factor TFIIB
MSVDALGRIISPGRRSEVWRLYREDVRAMNRRAPAGFSESDVRFMAQSTGLPTAAMVEAGRIHTKWRSEFPRQSGLRNEDCAAAAIIMAARLHRANIRTESIIEATGAKTTSLWRAVNRLRRETGIVDPVTLNPGAEPFIVSISAMFGVPAKVREEARRLLNGVKDFGYKPSCFGAGAVFAAYKLLGIKPPFGQIDVALAVGTTDTCLRNSMRIILDANGSKPEPIVIL